MTSVNYLLRPNKNVERKLIVDCLKFLRQAFGIDAYTYVGMGSMWFVDFIMVHKELGIRRMFSIEADPQYHDRAEFNKPYDCITIARGEATKVLPTLGLEAQRVLVWLDYNGTLSGPWKEDARIVCSKAPSGSIVLLTLNAERRQLDDVEDRDGNPLSQEEALRLYAGDVVPTPLPPDSLTTVGFPKLVGETLLRHLGHATYSSGAARRFVPLFNFRYSDGARMVTAGGMITSASDEELLAKCSLSTRFEFVGAVQQFQIEVPVLTYKEKMALDQLLPAAAALDPKGQLGWTLREAELQAYQRFYKHYPVFIESSS